VRHGCTEDTHARIEAAPVIRHAGGECAMSFLQWTAAIGLLLLIMAMLSGLLQRLPVATSLVYLAIGLGVGPLGLGWLALDLGAHARWVERITELAVVASLFFGGLKLRLRLTHASWRSGYRLATWAMLLSIAGVAVAAHLLLGLGWPLSLLLGAILAPTDPVLAGMVTVDDPSDRDPMRYALSGEAGLNDGMAFPFVVLALLLLDGGPLSLGEWALGYLWAIPAGFAFGFLLGRVTGMLVIRLHSRFGDATAPSDFLALALMALAYAGAELLHALGFVAVFAAGLGLRRTEFAISRRSPLPQSQRDDSPPPPADQLVNPNRVTAKELDEPAVAAGVVLAEALNFGATLERLLEVALMILIGVVIASNWSAAGVLLAALFFVVLRPLAAWLSLLGTPTRPRQRALIGWLGIRGIGSIYYLAYAFGHGLRGEDARTLSALVITVVAISVTAHGLTAQPLLSRYRRLER
jgi:NhaP-type Na+/H+ or K+/H+ antiporter